MNTENTFVDIRNIKSRSQFMRWLFPYNHCFLPDAPLVYKDVLICITRCELSIFDRVRILLTGKVEVESRTVTENEIGKTVTKSVITCGVFKP